MNMDRRNIASESPMEAEIGFSRAVRMGNWIAVAGTAAVAADGSPLHPGDVYAQARVCLERIIEAVDAAGGARENVVRTRVMLRDAERWRDAARAHGEVFADVRPACTFVEVSRFIDEAWLVEIEADCVIG